MPTPSIRTHRQQRQKKIVKIIKGKTKNFSNFQNKLTNNKKRMSSQQFSGTT